MLKIANARDTLIRQHKGTSDGLMIPDPHRIRLGKKYAVNDWLFHGLQGLAKRREAITVEEGKILGEDILGRLCQVRERSIKSAMVNKCAWGTQDCSKDIEELFRKELDSAKRESPLATGSQRTLQTDIETPALSLTKSTKFYLESTVFLVSRKVNRLITNPLSLMPIVIRCKTYCS